MSKDDTKGASRFELNDMLARCRQERDYWRAQAEMALDTVEHQGAKITALCDQLASCAAGIPGIPGRSRPEDVDAELHRLRRELAGARDQLSDARLNIWLNQYGRHIANGDDHRRALIELLQRNRELQQSCERLRMALAEEHHAAALFVSTYAEQHFNRRVSIERYLVADILTGVVSALQDRPLPPALTEPDGVKKS